MKTKKQREPEEGVAYCHIDNCTTLLVKYYDKTKKMVTYIQDGQQYTKSLAMFTKLVAKRDRE